MEGEKKYRWLYATPHDPSDGVVLCERNIGGRGYEHADVDPYCIKVYESPDSMDVVHQEHVKGVAEGKRAVLAFMGIDPADVADEGSTQ